MAITQDNRFYEHIFTYHWPLHGFGLNDAILKKVYANNALKIMKRMERP